MLKAVRYVAVLFLLGVFIIVLTSSTSIADNQYSKPFDEENAAAMAADLFFLRPLGNIAIAAGTKVFIISMPYSVLGGNFKRSVRKLVVEPFKFTWIRPLGSGID